MQNLENPEVNTTGRDLYSELLFHVGERQKYTKGPPVPGLFHPLFLLH